MNGVNIGKISCKDCKQELPWSFLEKHTQVNFGGMRSFDICVTYYPLADGKQHCIVRCDDCTKVKGVSSPARASAKQGTLNLTIGIAGLTILPAATGRGSNSVHCESSRPYQQQQQDITSLYPACYHDTSSLIFVTLAASASLVEPQPRV
jgi:hypothetical protein